MTYIHKQLLSKHDPTGKRRELLNYETGLRAGDIIKVTYLDRSDVTGRIIAIKRGQRNLGSNILLRTQLNRVLEILKYFINRKSTCQELLIIILGNLEGMLMMLKHSLGVKMEKRRNVKWGSIFCI